MQFIAALLLTEYVYCIIDQISKNKNITNLMKLISILTK